MNKHGFPMFLKLIWWRKLLGKTWLNAVFPLASPFFLGGSCTSLPSWGNLFEEVAQGLHLFFYSLVGKKENLRTRIEL
jgi:hypothetical protein